MVSKEACEFDCAANRKGITLVLHFKTELYDLRPYQELSNCRRINHLSFEDEKGQPCKSLYFVDSYDMLKV
jgi:hypothetical protein